MDIVVSKVAQDYKLKIEKALGSAITIRDRKEHPNWKLKTRSFVDGNNVFTDPNLSKEDLERNLFHELTHIYLRLLGYPKVWSENKLSPLEEITCSKILSLAEDRFVEMYLVENNYPYSDYDYCGLVSELRRCNKSGAFASFGGEHLSNEVKILVTQVSFIRLLIDEKYTKAGRDAIKKACINTLGLEDWSKIKSISKTIRGILNAPGRNQVKQYKLFQFLLKQFNLQNKVLIELPEQAKLFS